MKLESALAKLRTPRRIALLHYSPVSGTLAGEPPEIFPFLGSSRLEEPLHRYRWTPFSTGMHTAALWRARPSTASRLQRGEAAAARRRPEQPPFLLFELPREAGAEQATAGVAQ